MDIILDSSFLLLLLPQFFTWSITSQLLSPSRPPAPLSSSLLSSLSFPLLFKSSRAQSAYLISIPAFPSTRSHTITVTPSNYSTGLDMGAAMCSCAACTTTICTTCCPQMGGGEKLGRTGTYCSFFLICISVLTSIVTQQYSENIYEYLTQWDTGCEDDEYGEVCRSNSAVFRLSMALALFFFIQTIACYMTALWFDRMWPIKYLVFAAVVTGFFFASSEVFDSRGYAWFARFAGFFYVILQQIILLDFAYIWNKKWVDFAFEDGKDIYKYLLLIFSVSLFSGCAVSIAFMFVWFSKKECPDNDTILSLTVVFSFIATIYQLCFTERGSLLTSAILVSYATYVCFSAISLNPNVECNPTIGTQSQEWSQVYIFLPPLQTA